MLTSQKNENFGVCGLKRSMFENQLPMKFKTPRLSCKELVVCLESVDVPTIFYLKKTVFCSQPNLLLFSPPKFFPISLDAFVLFTKKALSVSLKRFCFRNFNFKQKWWTFLLFFDKRSCFGNKIEV